ncbi:MAG: SMP-30/gluconolactonase/LRE family protein [Thermoanaerobaculia bacterium]
MGRLLLVLLLTAISATAQGIAPDARLETLFEDAVFTEGPAAAPDGSIYFSDITASARSNAAGHILRYDPATGRTTVYRSPSGMANGIAFDSQGRMVVAEGADFGGRRVTRTDMATGRSEVVARTFNGRAFNSPNDVAVDASGRIWFSDPRYVGGEPIEQPVQGVYRIDADGSIHLAVADAGKPNGVAVSPDQKTLYVAATDNGATGPLPAGMSPAAGRMAILAYDIAADGSASFREVVVDLAGRGFADGLTVDAAGNIWCGCGPLGVRAFTPEGREIAAVAIPASATNVEFGRGDDAGSLYVTAGGALYRVRTNARGFHPGV